MWFFPFFFLIVNLHHPASIFAYEQAEKVTITASIAENRVTIFGYTSPKSRVELSSPRVFAVTYSNDIGYFIFDKSLLPKNPSELCLISYDNNFRPTHPVCIPPPPPINYHTDIGPILLPPTVSLEKNNINPNSTVITSGQAIPNSLVNINFYKVNNAGLSFPKEVQAYSLPPLTVTTDSSGNFSLNLPTAYSSDYRLFVWTKFNENYSPKSNTLIYYLPSFFSLFLQKYPFLYFLLLLFFVTLIIFFYLLYCRRSTIYHLPSNLPAVRNVSLSIISCPTKTNH